MMVAMIDLITRKQNQLIIATVAAVMMKTKMDS